MSITSSHALSSLQKVSVVSECLLRISTADCIERGSVTRATLDSTSTMGRSSASQQLLPWATIQQSGGSVMAVAKLSHSACS